MSKPTIAIVGTGYVGLTTAVILAKAGYKVFTIDIDPKKIAIINEGRSYFYEAGLDGLVSEGIKSGNLVATTDYTIGIPEADIVFSCVGTPDLPDGSSNLEYIFAAASSTAELAKQDVIYVQKSTVPVGTGRRVIEHIKTTNPELNFEYVSNPEFLAEGSAVYDTLNMDRIVLGSDSFDALDQVVAVYKDVDELSKSQDLESVSEYVAIYKNKKQTFNETPYDDRVVLTGLESAELIKVTANAFLALKISFANSIAVLCDLTGADINEVTRGVGMDHRIGRAFLYAGLGWGGGCFPKDVSGLISAAQGHGVELDIMHAAVNVNNAMPEYVVTKLLKSLGSLEQKKIAVLGLSFKPGTSDVRRSQSINLANKLAESGATVTAFDPFANEEAAPKLHKSIQLFELQEDAVREADAVVIATEWPEIVNSDFSEVLGLMNGNILIDSRNRLDKKDIQELGFTYLGIGRGV